MTIITVGIYQLYWYVAFQVELKKATKEGFGGLGHIVVTFLTLFIYALYWQYAAGKRLAKQGASDFSLIYIIFCFVGLAWLNPFLMQHQANGLKK
jgi:hypothetical protein